MALWRRNPINKKCCCSQKTEPRCPCSRETEYARGAAELPELSTGITRWLRSGAILEGALNIRLSLRPAESVRVTVWPETHLTHLSIKPQFKKQKKGRGKEGREGGREGAIRWHGGWSVGWSVLETGHGH